MKVFKKTLVIFCICLSPFADSYATNIDVNALGEVVASSAAGDWYESEYVRGSTSIMIAVQPDSVPQVARYGFRSLLETILAGGNGNLENRLQELGALQGLYERLGVDQVPWNPSNLYPKSAFLIVDALNKELFIKRYGSVFFKFGPHVHKRATWSISDSIRVGGYEKFNPGYKPIRHKRTIDYSEAQIWGDVNLNDASEVYVEESEFKAERKKFMDVAKSFGLTIYTFQWVSSSASTHGFKKIKKVGTFEKNNRPPEVSVTEHIRRHKKIKGVKKHAVEANVIISILGSSGEKVAVDYIESLFRSLPKKLRTAPLISLQRDSQRAPASEEAKALIIRRARNYRKDTFTLLRKMYLFRKTPLPIRAEAFRQLFLNAKLNEETLKRAKQDFKSADFLTALQKRIGNDELMELMQQSVKGGVVISCKKLKEKLEPLFQN